MNQIKREEDYNMIDWFKKVVIENYVNFSGRARRSEYWYFTLVKVILFIIPITITFIGLDFEGSGDPSTLFYIGLGIIILLALALLLPSIAVAARRLHDTGKSGWFYLIGLSNIGGIVLLVFYCIDGEKRNNKWGPNPKTVNTDEIDEIGISVE